MLTKLSDDNTDNNEAQHDTDQRKQEIVMKLQQIDKLKQEIETQLNITTDNPTYIDKLRDNNGNVASGAEDDAKVSYNSVGQLQEQCMKSGLSLPRYNDLGYDLNIGQFKECSI